MKNRAKALIILIFICVSIMGQTPISSKQFQKLNQTIYAIKKLYVDTVSDSKLVEHAITGMLEKLDPHSVYIPASEVQRANEAIKGSFDGIGIQFLMQKDTLVVTNPLRNCPAEKVGVLMGDKIIKVDGENIAGVGIKTSDIMSKLRGKRGTKVNISVLRRGVKDPIDFVITRDKIPLYSVEAAYEIAPKVGYINISNFSTTTFDEFNKALAKLQKQGITSLIIDLQTNGGGVMDAAINIVELFLTRNREILYTEGSNFKRQSYFSGGSMSFSGNVVVLINEYSASASEILAGALQDWDRAVIVGRRSFGKGIVQRPLNLVDGSEIRLTIARYYTPSGRNIQKPYGSGIEQYQKELWNRKAHGELQNTDSISFPDSLKFKTLLLKRTVYGGGGIMPDVFVPLDTTSFTGFHRDILAKGILNQYITELSEKDGKSIKKRYPVFELFDKGFAVTDDMFAHIVSEAEKNKITIDEKQIAQSKPSVMLQIKALLARTLYEEEDFYKIMNRDNEIVLKGIEVINNFNNYLPRELPKK